MTLLRGAFAVALTLLFALQPGLFAVASASGMHDGGLAQSSAMVHGDSGVADHHASNADHAHSGHDAGIDHHGKRMAGDKSCEVHCAPAQAVPVDCPLLPQPSRGCFEPAIEASLLHGMNHEFIKPPRT